MKKILIAISMLCSLNVFPQTNYVSTTGNDANDGASWATAFRTLQKALSAASSGQVWVAAGTYYPDEGPGVTNNDRFASFYLKNNLALYGGFNGTETSLSQRDWKNNVTTLSGDIDQVANIYANSFHVVRSTSINNTATLDGFTITGGNATMSGYQTYFGGGMFNSSSSPRVINCHFTGNASNYGGGMCNIYSSHPTVINCSFTGNSSPTLYGGAMYNNGSSPTITNCRFSSNTATYGGAISNYSSSAAITNCTFLSNSAPNGGAVHNFYSPATLTNCIFSLNTATYGGAVHNYSSAPSISYCTFSGNTATSGKATYSNLSSPALSSCILWGGTGLIFYTSNSSTTVSYSIVQGGYSGTGNVNADPLFVNAAAGDFHLQPCSPAVDAGRPTGAPTTDLEGNPRPVISGYDMGAYEFQNSFPPLILTPPADFSVNTDVGKCEAVVLYSGDHAATTSGGCGTVLITYFPVSGSVLPIGETTVTITANDAKGNTANGSFKVTVVDDQDPTITAPPDIVNHGMDAGACLATVNLGTPETGDNCGVASVTSDAPPAFAKGTHTVTWTVKDVNGRTATATQSVQVVDDQDPVPTIATLTAVTGECSATVSAPTATDNCAGFITASTNDPTVYTSQGSYNITWVFDDGNGNIITQTQSVVVDDVSKPTFTASANRNVDLETGCQITVPDLVSGLSGSDNCTSSTVVFTQSPAAGQKIATSHNASHNVIVYADDGHGNVEQKTVVLTAIDRTVPVITVPEAQKLRFLAPPNHKMVEVPLGYSVSDNCATGLTYDITIEKLEATTMGDSETEVDFVKLSTNSVLLRAERCGTGEGRTYRITVTATDAANNTTTATMDVIVAHNITHPVSGKAFKIGSTVAMAGTFWDKAGNKHTAKWSLDGTTTVRGVVTEPVGRKNGTVTGSYKFTTPGVYKLQMNVTDQAGVTTYANTNGELDAIVVIYDPSGGYTVGGGWFNSPAGALTKDVTARGPVSFGFQTNYYKGATLPKGETQFSFIVGELEFNALNFDYLVVDKAKAQFKGSGRIIGGQSGISFIMTVIDGALDGTGLDKIRMKIYNKNTGEVYYDSQPGASDADDPTTVVGDGSIIEIGGTSMSAPVTVNSLSREGNDENLQDVVLEVKAMPNPSAHRFTLITRSSSVQPLTVRVIDNWGRVIEVKSRVAANGTLYLGSHYRPGIYYVEVVQNTERRMLKLVKR